MASIEKFKKQRKEQLIQWRVENQLGFDLWKTTSRFGGGENDFIILESIQAKDGVYIIQTDQRDFSFLIFKCQADICIKTPM